MSDFAERESEMEGKQAIVPVEPGTLLQFSPERDTENWLVSGWTLLGKPIPFVGNHVFEVNRYILDNEGQHVTFKRCRGTFVTYGGGRMEDIEFPYPHPMFEVIGDAEAKKLRLEWAVDDLIDAATHRWPFWLRWLDRLPWPATKFAQA